MDERQTPNEEDMNAATKVRRVVNNLWPGK